MNLLTVLIVFKDGSQRTINNVLNFRFYTETNLYRFTTPFFVLHEAIFDKLDIVDSNRNFFLLDSIDSIEVF